MRTSLKVQNLTKTYPGFSLDGVSFRLPAGYIMGLIGPNGAGKTTTIRLILNSIPRTDGAITVLELDNIREEITVKEHIGVVGDSNCFPTSWSIVDVEQAMGLFYASWDGEAFAGYLHKFRLDTSKKVADLSRGMQMKLMLACALSYDNRLLILDEPASGLDPVSRDELLTILADYVSDGEHSVLFSTHITSDLEKIADYITYLRDGEVFYTGSKDEFMDAFRLIKGGPDELSADLEPRLLGLRRYSSGFEALIRTEDVPRSTEALVTAATIDDIVVFTNSEEKTAIDRFYTTIPILEEQRVIGRYVFLFIFGTAGMLLSFVIQGLIYTIMQLRFTAADYILAILGGLFLYLFFVAIETPFYYRFGAIKGRFSLFIPLFTFMVFSFGLNWLESRQIVIPAVLARLLEDRIQLLLLAGIVVLVLLALSLMASMRWRPEESN